MEDPPRRPTPLSAANESVPASCASKLHLLGGPQRASCRYLSIKPPLSRRFRPSRTSGLAFRSRFQMTVANRALSSFSSPALDRPIPNLTSGGRPPRRCRHGMEHPAPNIVGTGCDERARLADNSALERPWAVPFQLGALHLDVGIPTETFSRGKPRGRSQAEWSSSSGAHHQRINQNPECRNPECANLTYALQPCSRESSM